MIIDAAWQRFLLSSRCLFNSKNKLVCQEHPENLGIYLCLIFQLLLLYQHPVRVHDCQFTTNFSPVPDWHCPLWIKVMGKLEKVIVENGIIYVLGEDDIYYPDLQLPRGTNYNIGKYGHMRCEYLKEFRYRYYMELLLEGKLNEYLHEIDEECYEMLTGLWNRWR